MNENKTPQDVWKEDDHKLPGPIDADDICTLARQREHSDLWVRRLCLFALAGLAIAFARNAWGLDSWKVRVGQLWMLIVMTVYFWRLIAHRTERRMLDETCAGFLLRSAQKRLDGFTAVRTVILLIVPGVLMSGWGHGAALKARAMGLDPSSPYYRYLNSAWPGIATWVLLILVWVGFSSAAKKASDEFNALRGQVE